MSEGRSAYNSIIRAISTIYFNRARSRSIRTPKGNCLDAIRPIRKPDLLSEDLGEELLICEPEDRIIHVLNATARLLWELCDGHHTLADMENAVREKFRAPEEHDVGGDILQTLQELSARGLLKGLPTDGESSAAHA